MCWRKFQGMLFQVTVLMDLAKNIDTRAVCKGAFSESSVKNATVHNYDE